jgi:hypothetical protein
MLVWTETAGYEWIERAGQLRPVSFSESRSDSPHLVELVLWSTPSLENAGWMDRAAIFAIMLWMSLLQVKPYMIISLMEVLANDTEDRVYKSIRFRFPVPHCLDRGTSTWDRDWLVPEKSTFAQNASKRNPVDKMDLHLLLQGLDSRITCITDNGVRIVYRQDLAVLTMLIDTLFVIRQALPEIAQALNLSRQDTVISKFIPRDSAEMKTWKSNLDYMTAIAYELGHRIRWKILNQPEYES